MPKKGSRRISVDGTDYRWRVSNNPSNRGDTWNPIRFAVERVEEAGGVLTVSLPFARPDNGFGARTMAIRPVLVSECIRRAVEAGWDPRRPGSPFTLDVTEDDLTALLGEPPRYLIPFLWGLIPEGGSIKDLPRAVQIHPRNDTPSDEETPSGR
ncbi:hypothetical protein GCM10022224_089010 [Nonomuraea antimicrobica]|uniref:Uncharacterized protein n=2 Tax=Nonomuraea antimicrobica TaxID=561173 RepID=A0ABP7DVF2_9ACTN